MRRVARYGAKSTDNERGAIAVLTAVMMTALLGMGALAIDVGMMYSEKAQLQNGADAAALAIAQACAATPTSTTCQQQKAAASGLVGGNALDGFTHIFTPKLDEKNLTVDVEVQTRDTANNKYFSLAFARILGIDRVDIRATAQAKLDGYSRAYVMPLAFSQCESDPSLAKGVMFFRVHGNSSKPVCKSVSQSGAELPGGFGWLQHDVVNGKCVLSINISNAYKSDTGGIPADCKTKFSEFETALKAGKKVEALVPIFDYVTGSGAEATFYIEAFAQISLRGWQFNGETYLTPDAQALSTSMKLTPSDHGLFGEYTRKVSLEEAAVLGGPNKYKAGGVRLSN